MIKREKNIRFDKFFKDYRIINNKNIEIEIRYILDQLIERNNEILLFIILSKQFFQFHLKLFSIWFNIIFKNFNDFLDFHEAIINDMNIFLRVNEFIILIFYIPITKKINDIYLIEIQNIILIWLNKNNFRMNYHRNKRRFVNIKSIRKRFWYDNCIR